STPITLESNDSRLDPSIFLRLDLEDLPLPSFHRPDLENYWFHRLLNSTWLSQIIPDSSDRAKAIITPFDLTTGNPNYGLSAQQAGQIAAIKRKISMRPIREDHLHFDGSNV